MLKTFDRLFRRTPRTVIMVISVLLVGAVATLDSATGTELSFSIFYLLPVSLAAWYVGGWSGPTISVLAAGTWFAIDATDGGVYSSPFIPYWNAAVRLGFFVLVAGLLTNLHRHLRMEEKLARIDGLTGVMSGRTFRHSAAEIIGLAGRNEKPFTLVYVDLDDFKKVNDTRGHAEGDRALKAVASALMNSVRRTDIVGRLGGDEFAVLLPETAESGAREVIEKIRANLTARRRRVADRRQHRRGGVSRPPRKPRRGHLARRPSDVRGQEIGQEQHGLLRSSSCARSVLGPGGGRENASVTPDE